MVYRPFLVKGSEYGDMQFSFCEDNHQLLNIFPSCFLSIFPSCLVPAGPWDKIWQRLAYRHVLQQPTCSTQTGGDARGNNALYADLNALAVPAPVRQTIRRRGPRADGYHLPPDRAYFIELFHLIKYLVVFVVAADAHAFRSARLR
eukprot:6188228-Pleurochrysis_carterae.AAC.3